VVAGVRVGTVIGVGMERPFWSTGTVSYTEPGGPEFEPRTPLVIVL